MAVVNSAGGQTLPGGCCLSVEPGISRVTVRRALNLLSRDGHLLRQQGARQRAGASPDLPADGAAHTSLGDVAGGSRVS